MLIKYEIYNEDLILNIYVLTTISPNYLKQKFLDI